jgi:thiosulfate/3-mercaptopyruvate sulfurtransferase
MQAVVPLARRLAPVAAFAILLLAAAGPGAPVQAAQSEAAPLVPPLVDVAWLLDNAGQDGLVVLDLRSEPGGGSEAAYRAGHIPGAVYSNYLMAGWRTEIDGVPAQLPRLETLEALIGELGIGNDSHVVLVAAGSSALDMSSATRIYWTFKVLGHDRVSILDGGYRAYAADPANPVETGWVEPLPDIFEAAFRPEMVADRAAVQAALQAGRPLVDARPTDYFLGAERHTWAKRAGTIPGAISLPESLLVDAEGRLVKAERVAELLQRVGLPRAGAGAAEETIFFCNTGHWSTLAWFAESEILGRKNVRVYDGSMVDWSAEPALPMQQGVPATQ